MKNCTIDKNTIELVQMKKTQGSENMEIRNIQTIVQKVAKEYPIKKITLFGSRADNTNRDDSDVDLIIEFKTPISLLTLSKLRIRLEELLQLNVDIIHGPLHEEDLIEVNKEVELYVAQR